MSEFTIHTIPGSPFASSVMLALHEKGAPWRLAPLSPGMHKQQPYLSLHPFGRMPVLRHDDFVLYETQAILRYLDRVLLAPALMPDDPKAAARMDQVMNINDCYLFQGVNSVIGFQRVVGPMLMGLVPDEAVIVAAMPQAHAVFDELDRLLGSKAFFAGDRLSLADLLVAPQIDFLAQTPEWVELTAKNRNLLRWFERMRERPSMIATTWERVREMSAAA